VTRFRQALLDELKTRVSAPAPVPRGSRRFRPRLAFGGAALAVVSAAAAVLVSQTASTPAYAVTSHSDGSVSVKLNHIGDPAEANRRLREAGVPAIVMPESRAQDCPAADRGNGRLVSGVYDVVEPGGKSDLTAFAQTSVTLRPGEIPADAMFVLVPRESAGARGAVLLVFSYDKPGPRCVVVPASPETDGLPPVPRDIRFATPGTPDPTVTNSP
jgi:hypothetical protein